MGTGEVGKEEGVEVVAFSAVLPPKNPNTLLNVLRMQCTDSTALILLIAKHTAGSKGVRGKGWPW